MTRMMGADDLVGVMTPTMSPSQITFGRRTKVIEDGLRDNWALGTPRHRSCSTSASGCTGLLPADGSSEPIPSLAGKQMIARRRERMVLDSLQDLIRHMGGDPRGPDGGDRRVATGGRCTGRIRR